MIRANFSLSVSRISAAFTINPARLAKLVLRNAPKDSTARCSFASRTASEIGSNVFSTTPVAGFVVAMLMTHSSESLIGHRRELQREKYIRIKTLRKREKLGKQARFERSVAFGIAIIPRDYKYKR